MSETQLQFTPRHAQLAQERERVGMDFLTTLLEPHGIDSSWVGKYMQMLFIHVVSYPRSGLSERLQPKEELGELFCLLTGRPSGSEMNERAVEGFWRGVLPEKRLDRLAMIPDAEIPALYKSLKAHFAATLTPQALEQIRGELEAVDAIENPWGEPDLTQAGQDLAAARGARDRTQAVDAVLRLAGIFPADFFSYALSGRSGGKLEAAEEILQLLTGRRPGRHIDLVAIGGSGCPELSPYGRWKSARRLSRQLTPEALAVCREQLSGGEAWMAPPKRDLLSRLSR